MNPKETVKRSKRLSLILRHDPASIGIALDEAGWTDVEGLLKALNWSKDDLDIVVQDNNKKRFEYDDAEARIRASQGHSVDVELGYEAKTPPDTLYHGTSRNVLGIVLVEGLKKMNRHHVHLSVDDATALNVGGRHGSAVALRVNAASMVKDGHAFYVSTNGVWLVDAVPPAYLTVV